MSDPSRTPDAQQGDTFGQSPNQNSRDSTRSWLKSNVPETTPKNNRNTKSQTIIRPPKANHVTSQVFDTPQPQDASKELTSECFQRICLMSMENERLLTKIIRVEDDCLEKKRELEIYRGRCEKLEKSKELDQGTDLKLINLRQDRDKLDSALRESNQKIESFQNRIFEMEVQASSNQAVESELRRTLREKQDLAEQMTKLTKTNIEMGCELEKLSEMFKIESIDSAEKIRHLDENLRLIDSEKEVYKDMLRRKEDVENRLRQSTDECDA
jgi:chromosome segregation ATPase